MNTGADYLLIVEDDPDILHLLDTTLSFRGYHVITAQNGKEALEVIRKKRPAVVIADIMMPKLDGFGLVHRMRIEPETRDIPVVFITATYVSPQDKEFALNLGATRFLQKPIELEAFLKTIAELLQQGLPTIIRPLDELEFYNEYRKRLKGKLDEKMKQIARDERLLSSAADKDNEPLQSSLHQAMCDRDELILLLEKINEHLKKYPRAA